MTPALVGAFIVVPLLEIYVIILVGHAIGGWLTVALLFAVSAAGASLLRREGRRTWQSFNASLASGRMPGREIADGALVLVGGALLLAPGFITDAVGLLLVLPFTRPLARRLVLVYAERRVLRGGAPRVVRVRARRGPGRSTGDGRENGSSGADGPGGAGGGPAVRVIEGETVHRDQPPGE